MGGDTSLGGGVVDSWGSASLSVLALSIHVGLSSWASGGGGLTNLGGWVVGGWSNASG